MPACPFIPHDPCIILVPLGHFVQVGLIQSTPLLSKEPFLLKGCLRSTPGVSSSHHAAERSLMWVSGYIRSQMEQKLMWWKVVQWPWPVVTMKWMEYDLTEPKFLSLNRIKISRIRLHLSVTPFFQQWCHEIFLSIKESGIYWSFKLEVLQKHTFKKSGFSPNLFSRRMSGWWTLKNFSINIMNFVFEIKHKNNAFVQGLDIT